MAILVIRLWLPHVHLRAAAVMWMCIRIALPPASCDTMLPYALTRDVHSSIICIQSVKAGYVQIDFLPNAAYMQAPDRPCATSTIQFTSFSVTNSPKGQSDVSGVSRDRCHGLNQSAKRISGPDFTITPAYSVLQQYAGLKLAHGPHSTVHFQLHSTCNYNYL